MNPNDIQDNLKQSLNGVTEGRNVAEKLLDRVSDEARPVVDRLAQNASDAARWAREQSDRVRDEVRHASNRSVGYVRDEPVRAVLMAAAAGAVIYALSSYFSGRSRR
jgi:ElaB/YqjD/DUF883 family membrane-anchored ribosome-binding protein